MAHEIKNPLTPIQLAAERLELRLGPKLSNDDALILHRAISTISTQVDALKQMVNDFREYAKLPQAKLSALDLNNFLSEIAQLYQEAGTSIKLDFEKNIPLIEGDPAQLRQVLHNLIKNSIDAAEGEDPGIVIQTRHIVTDSGMNAVQLHLHDNGVGFSENILNRAFEPYITTKPRAQVWGYRWSRKFSMNTAPSSDSPIGQIRAAPSSMAHKLTFSSSTCSCRPQGSFLADFQLRRAASRIRKMTDILIVDDELGIRNILSEILGEQATVLQRRLMSPKPKKL